MDYKVGDVVKLKNFNGVEAIIPEGCIGNITEEMRPYFNGKVTISSIIIGNFFTIEGLDSLFSFSYIKETETIKGVETVWKSIRYNTESPHKSREQLLVNGARLIIKEFDSIRDDLKALNVNLSISFNGDTGHAIIRAEKTIQL